MKGKGFCLDGRQAAHFDLAPNFGWDDRDGNSAVQWVGRVLDHRRHAVAIANDL